jgi:hypothetical protein
MPFAGSYGMTMLFLAPPRCNLFAMDFSRALLKDLLNYVNQLRKKLIRALINFILFFDLLPRQSPQNQSDRAPLTSPSGLASFPNPPLL